MRSIAFTLSREQLLAAARANTLRKWPRFAFIFISSMAFVGLIFPFLVDRAEKPNVQLIATYAGLAVATTAVLIVLTHFIKIPRMLDRALRHFDQPALDWQADWDDTHLHVKNGDGETRVKLCRLAGWRNAGGALMIYRSPDVYYVFPDDAFASDDQRADLISALSASSVGKL